MKKSQQRAETHRIPTPTDQCRFQHLWRQRYYHRNAPLSIKFNAIGAYVCLFLSLPLLGCVPLPVAIKLCITALIYIAIAARPAQSMRCFEGVLNSTAAIRHMGAMGRFYAIVGPRSVVAFLLFPLLLSVLWGGTLHLLLARLARLLFLPHFGLVAMFRSDAARRGVPAGVLRRMDAHGPCLLRVGGPSSP